MERVYQFVPAFADRLLSRAYRDKRHDRALAVLHRNVILISEYV
jgi:hypothetical protein